MTRRPARSRRLFGPDEIRRAVDRIADQVGAIYAGRELTVVAVLNGALVFTADLIRRLDMPVQLETVTASSYRGDATSPGDLQVRIEEVEHLRGKDVLLVDDILDTGRTLERVGADIRAWKPASLRVAVLLDKPDRRVADVQADFVGMTIPDVFVVGYGLDHDGRWRHLPEILALDPAPAAGEATATA